MKEKKKKILICIILGFAVMALLLAVVNIVAEIKNIDYITSEAVTTETALENEEETAAASVSDTISASSEASESPGLSETAAIEDASNEAVTSEADGHSQAVTDFSSEETTTVIGKKNITKNLTVSAIDMSTLSGSESGTRRTVSGSRLYVDNENPLFMFQRVSVSGKSVGESLVMTYQALPADIRPFSAMYYDDGTAEDISTHLSKLAEVLAVTDQYNVPVIIQLENWNSEAERDGYTYDQVVNLFNSHPSLVGIDVVELSCCSLLQKELDRMKVYIRACQSCGALFIWQEMEYSHCVNTVNCALEDEELYQLMTDYAENIIIEDKHNGQGRHFSTQSSALGAWLSGVCGNWGSNVESWLWWEEGLGDYNQNEGDYRSYSDSYTIRYAPALGGIDTICDLVGGAAMYSTENLRLIATDGDRVVFTEAFYDTVYPLYQKILNGALPTKEEVKSNIKVAYQFTNPKTDKQMMNIESKLFRNLYAGTTQWYRTYKNNGASKEWIPKTGRYYIIPALCKYVDAQSILPGAAILHDSDVGILSNTDDKVAYFNEKYAETYTGDGTLFEMNGYTYLFNNKENQTVDAEESIRYHFTETDMEADFTLKEHTYIVASESGNKLSLEINNLRLDASDYLAKRENWSEFMSSYLNGGKMDSDFDRRETVIELSGFSGEPGISISGNNSPEATMTYDESTGTCIIKVISNGCVKLEITR